VFVKSLGSPIFGVNRKNAKTGNVGNLHGTLHGIAQKSGGNALALPIEIDAKPGQDNDGDRMAGKFLLQPIRRMVISNMTHGKRVEANNFFAADAGIGLLSVCPLANQGVARQIPI
jgi:hypothetical protein